MAFSLLGQLSHMRQRPWEVFRLWYQLPSCPVYIAIPGMASSCGVFRGADMLVISCSDALCAMDLLGCLRMWYLQGSRLSSCQCQQKCRIGVGGYSGVCPQVHWASKGSCGGTSGVFFPNTLSTVDLLGFLRIWCLQGSRLPRSLSQPWYIFLR